MAVSWVSKLRARLTSWSAHRSRTVGPVSYIIGAGVLSKRTLREMLVRRGCWPSGGYRAAGHLSHRDNVVTRYDVTIPPSRATTVEGDKPKTKSTIGEITPMYLVLSSP
jgi:hypothetical protein